MKKFDLLKKKTDKYLSIVQHRYICWHRLRLSGWRLFCFSSCFFWCDQVYLILISSFCKNSFISQSSCVKSQLALMSPTRSFHRQRKMTWWWRRKYKEEIKKKRSCRWQLTSSLHVYIYIYLRLFSPDSCYL